MVGEFALNVGRDGLQSFFENTRTKTDAAVAANPGGTQRAVHIHTDSNGPGYAFSSYLPSSSKRRIQDGAEVVQNTFLPHTASEETIAARKEAVAMAERAKKEKWRREDWPVVPPLLRTKQLNIDAELWKIRGEVYHGSHMPIAVGLNVLPRRSKEAKARRMEKSSNSWNNKWDSKRDDWHSGRSRNLSGPRGTERPSWSRSCGSDAEWQSAGWWQHRGWNNEEGAERWSTRQDSPRPESRTADEPQPQEQTEFVPQQTAAPRAGLDDTPSPTMWQGIPTNPVSMANPGADYFNRWHHWQAGYIAGL